MGQIEDAEVGAPEAPAPAGISMEELRLAARNHGMPLEALRYPVTPAGLHYLLIHYDIPDVDPDAWRLSVGGVVARPLSLSISDLRSRPAVTVPVTMECAGNGRALLEPRPISQPWVTEAVGTAEWTGTPVAGVLEEAGVGEGAVDVVFSGLDRGVEGDIEQRYERSLSMEDATRPEVILAYAMNGQPLLPQHGFPLRLVVPGWYGMASVKWLASVTVLGRPFDGYQNVHSYRLRSEEEEPGTPITRILPRSLMVPPGIPVFLTRTRHVAPGAREIRGRAWSGSGPVARVEFSTDGGATWADARLEEAVSPYAWQGWSIVWDATPGEHVLCCRATDAAGRTQPLAPDWNLGGYTNNAVQRVEVTVSPAG